MNSWLIIILCWLLFWCVWLAAAIGVKHTARRQAATSELAYRLPTLVGFVMLFAPEFFRGRSFRAFSESDLTHMIACGICIIGLAIAIWARMALAKNWSSSVVVKEEHELVENGPYKFVRHPIYTGMLLMALGTALNRGLIVAFIGLVIATIGFVIKLKQEERLMTEQFPGEYPSYITRTKAIIPFVL